MGMFFADDSYDESRRMEGFRRYKQLLSFYAGRWVKVNLLTGGGPANSTATITQYLYNYGIKSLDFGFGSAGAIVMTVLVLILSSFYIKRALG